MLRTEQGSMFAVAVVAAGLLSGARLYAEEAAPSDISGEQTMPGEMMGHPRTSSQGDQMMGMMQENASEQPQPDKG